MGYSSGPGSRGSHAAWKTEVLNEFFRSEHVQSVTDLGCGDGHVAALLGVQIYHGVDVLPRSVSQCRALMATRTFQLATPLELIDHPADVALSLEVIFHLEEDAYRIHLENLKRCAKRFMVICASEARGYEPRNFGAMRYHLFTDDIQWPLSAVVVDPHPMPKGAPEAFRQSFYIYERPRT